MTKSRITAWVTAAAVAVGVLMGVACFAADPPQKIGVVDLMKVDKDAPRIKQYGEEADKFRALLQQRLEIRLQNLMLDENEIRELIDLRTKENSSDKDKARAKELEDAERAKDAELKQLQETKEPDEAQKARLKQLQELQQKSKSTGEALRQDYEGQLQSKMIELRGQVETDLREAVKKIAEAKQLTMVVVKDVVYFGGIDITDDVIGKLDRK